MKTNIKIDLSFKLIAKEENWGPCIGKGLPLLQQLRPWTNNKDQVKDKDEERDKDKMGKRLAQCVVSMLWLLAVERQEGHMLARYTCVF